MVIVTFLPFPLFWTTKRRRRKKIDHFIVFTYLLLFLCCVFCSDVTWSLFVQEKKYIKKDKNSFQIMTKDIKAVSYLRFQVCCRSHIGPKARNSTICTKKSFVDVVRISTATIYYYFCVKMSHKCKLIIKICE